MNIFKNNFILGLIIFTAFLGIGVFGLLQFGHADHRVGAPMMNCPYAEGGYSICENTLDHITRWQQFSQVIVPGILALVFLFAIIPLVSPADRPGISQSFLRKYFLCKNKKLYSCTEDAFKWLSLLINSPSIPLKA